MAALNIGETAPDFSLPAMDGKAFSLKDALGRGPVVAVFFKISCPTCQYALPFLERLHKAYGAKAAMVVGVSQNSSKDTASFLKNFGVTFRIMLDDTETSPVSNAYGLTNVPTTFWIAQHGEIEVSSVGWDRSDFEQIHAKMAEMTRGDVVTIFQHGENVAAFRAG
jgi:peroxiredoxin